MADSPTVVQSCDMRAPSGASAPTFWQRLAGTGTTGDANVTALTAGAMATLVVGAAAVRFDFGVNEAAAITAASATSPILPAYGRLDWFVEAGRDQFIAVEAADGASAYEAHVWTSSGPRSAT
jgi:hypothetical protein